MFLNLTGFQLQGVDQYQREAILPESQKRMMREKRRRQMLGDVSKSNTEKQ